MSREQILAAIPHRDPFLFLDEIVERSADRIHCRKHFTGSEPFFVGHYPGQPVVPGVILCEAAMQAGAVLLAGLMAAEDRDGPSNKVPVATRIDGVRFKNMVRPGDTVDIEVTLIERLSNAWFLRAKLTSAGRTVARLEFACTITSSAAAEEA